MTDEEMRQFYWCTGPSQSISIIDHKHRCSLLIETDEKTSGASYEDS